MKYAIFSDIHSNLEAFQAALDSMDREGTEKRIFLGDIVGYGANPNECIELLKNNSDLVLAGNHDYGLIGKTGLDRFNRYAKEALLWTKEVISEDNIDYLESLPIREEFDSMTLVHSSPKEPERWHYITNPAEATEQFPAFNTQVCFIGHSHHPIIIEMTQAGEISGGLESEMQIKSGHCYIINAGSIGQPRDGNPDAAYCLYDSEQGLAKIIRVPYNIKGQQAKMKKAGLPERLIDRIEHGK
ncbi:MAG: metallophosphoesterase family protein [Nitrospinota bacterium]|nr:metallophosphatase family protein [Nitrospinota bacterium]